MRFWLLGWDLLVGWRKIVTTAVLKFVGLLKSFTTSEEKVV